ncbi:cofilin [Nematostella vectensis]|uniref:cofilin n=1 Tax=Nematostella vectensis TaxID=45351 RepID=UPI002076E1C4|nr:cofilin [Nematostella vectensis]
MKSMKTHKYAIFKICDEANMVVIDQTFKSVVTNTREEDRAIFYQMVEKLSDREPRYILYDMKFPRKEEKRIFNNLVFISWCSDKAPIEKKMKLASTQDYVRKKFSEATTSVNANDFDDLDYDEIAAKAEKTSN